MDQTFKHSLDVMKAAMPKKLRFADQERDYEAVAGSQEDVSLNDDSSTSTLLASTNAEKHPDDNCCKHPSSTWRQAGKGLFLILWWALVFVAAAAILQALNLFPVGVAPSALSQPFWNLRKPIHCGSSAAEARAMGCLYDPVSFVWQPPACHNQTYIETFLGSLPPLDPAVPSRWAQHVNETSGEPHGWISESDMREGRYDSGWVTWEYHRIHCVYTWWKLVFEVERGTSLDGYVWDRGHAMHCGKVALEKRSDESDIWNSRFDVQFPLCYA